MATSPPARDGETLSDDSEEMISNLADYLGSYVWNHVLPDGQRDMLRRICRENAALRAKADRLNDAMQNDVTGLLVALGIGTHARPFSPHDVVIDEVLPTVVALRAELAALRAKCDALDDALADETGRARSEESE